MNKIEKTPVIRLSVEDQRTFAETILNPPPPNDGADFEAFDHIMSRKGGEAPRPEDIFE
jgi:hypothetical protein